MKSSSGKQLATESAMKRERTTRTLKRGTDARSPVENGKLAHALVISAHARTTITRGQGRAGLGWAKFGAPLAIASAGRGQNANGDSGHDSPLGDAFRR